MSMSTLLTNSSSRIFFSFANCKGGTQLIPNIYLSIPSNHFKRQLHFDLPRKKSLNPNISKPYTTRRHSRASESESTIYREVTDKFNFDVFLSIAELIFLASSAIVSIGCVVNGVAWSFQKSLTVSVVNKVLFWQFIMLGGAVGIGALIRRRQWRRSFVDSLAVDGSHANVVERIAKLEEDLRSSATIIRVMSRQLEKLGTRFRVTRKALKEPISEAAALAQKNSEATRALAVQEDILEKELGEIQKVLLAMQDQQQKQLELILAVAKTGKLWESRRISNQGQSSVGNSPEGEKHMGTQQIPPMAKHKVNINDLP